MIGTKSNLIGADELQAAFQVGTGLRRSARPDQANAPGSHLLYDLDEPVLVLRFAGGFEQRTDGLEVRCGLQRTPVPRLINLRRHSWGDTYPNGAPAASNHRRAPQMIVSPAFRRCTEF